MLHFIHMLSDYEHLRGIIARNKHRVCAILKKSKIRNSFI